MSDREKLLEYLQANTQWHYGLDLCRELDISRSWIYVHLGSLEENGFVERKDGPMGAGSISRPMYRASRQRGLLVGAVSTPR